MMAAICLHFHVMGSVGLVILLALTKKTLSCRRGEPRSDLSARVALAEEMLILPSDGSCITMDSGTDQYGKIIASHDDSKSRDIFNVTILCVYVIRAKPPFQRVMLDFRWFDVSRRFIADPSCEHAGLTVYDGADPMTSSLLLNATCGSQRPRLLTSSQSSLSMQIYASGNMSVVDFTAVYSSFSDEQFCNRSDESEPRMVCLSTNRCIPVALSCDRQGVSNCGDEDYSDQLDEMEPSFCPVVYDLDWTLLVIISSCVAGLIGIFLIYWCCWRPGYIPWYLGRFRRTRCCELGEGCTTPSRHFCSSLCPCKSCTVCCCVATAGPDPSERKTPRNAIDGQRKVHQARLISRSEGHQRHDVNTPTNVFLVVGDGRRPIRAKGGKTKTVSRRQPLLPARANQDGHNTSQTKPFLHVPETHHTSSKARGDLNANSAESNSPSGPWNEKHAGASPRGKKASQLFTKKRVNPTFEPMSSAPGTPTRSGLERRPLGTGPRGGFHPQGSRGLTPDDKTSNGTSFQVYSDGGHVREGR